MKKLLALLLASAFCLALASILIVGQPATSNNTVAVLSPSTSLGPERISTPPQRPVSETSPPATPSPWKALASGAGIGAAIGSLITLYVKHLLEERKLRIIHEHRIVEKQTESFHEYTFNYYLPIITSLQNFLRRLSDVIRGETKIEGEDALKFSFYFFTRYWSTWSVVSRKMRGLFLTDKLTEDILSELEGKIVVGLGTNIGRENLSIIETVIEPGESFVDFNLKFKRPYFQLQKVFSKYCSWVNTMKNDTSFFDVLTSYCNLFIFEINQAYGAWYRRKPKKFLGKLSSKDLNVIKREVLEKLKGEISKKEEREFQERFEEE